MTTLKKVRQRAEMIAKSQGTHLNPDLEILNEILEGLKRNEERYGYPSCPCRLASGKLEFDRDIICPCDYKDPDVEEYGSCYCALYLRKDVFEGKTPSQSIPERRPREKQELAHAAKTEPEEASTGSLAEIQPVVTGKLETGMKMWYCRQCGYVCFREQPPYICPICKAERKMFAEVFITPKHAST